ncbi:MAG TPA: hypothetical protein DEX36_13175 [Glutamicibacter sp.]|uniref:Uncharacterized protein n=1 Tax=Glutamicibacter arilaitensis (strain DSM 16368 / CIP 108037 / IAM 15318 / JCM 13566 / NCIMB 14258 / Re117) TaxID=861360 RepID=A0ABM9Q113_GLUAR|nr:MULTISPECIES: hypothetical protein [Glutamicibacter]CBT77350.1 hypothetical protein AARI_31510 [Glutamicibacter arilaitensis Re117]HCH48830.1 hypothetical protein [Glutamicibacter sp.]
MTDNTASILEFAHTLAQPAEASKMTSVQAPTVAELLGKELASALGSSPISTVVVWDQIESAVLGHVVARELDAELIYAFSVEGSLGLSAELRSDSRVALISYDWSELHGLSALASFVESKGATVLSVGSVISEPNLEIAAGIKTHALTGSQLEIPDSLKEQHVVDNG